MQTEQLSLPYEEITNVACRKTLRARDDIKRSGKETWSIPFDKIQIRDGFNTRDYETAETVELAWSIVNNGQLEPTHVDILEDGRIFMEVGHRRYFAFKFAIENKLQKKLPNGTFITPDLSTMECFINGKDMTENERMYNIWNTNMHSKSLRPLESAKLVYRLKFCAGESLSNEELGERLGVSRQHIDDLLLIAGADDHMKDLIRSGALTVTEARKEIRENTKKRKAAEKAEENSHKTSASAASLPIDINAKELAELKELDNQAEIQKQMDQDKEVRELERLLGVADLVEISMGALLPYIHKRLAAPGTHTWKEDFADVDTGDIIPIERKQVIFAKGCEITEEVIDKLIGNRADPVYIYKANTSVESVVTEPPSKGEKSKYDLSRPEIEKIQRVIQMIDKIESITDKLDIPEQSKKDLSYLVHWSQENLSFVREWIHSNKKFNKKGF